MNDKEKNKTHPIKEDFEKSISHERPDPESSAPTSRPSSNNNNEEE